MSKFRVIVENVAFNGDQTVTSLKGFVGHKALMLNDQHFVNHHAVNFVNH